MSRTSSFSDQIRSAISSSGISRYAISKRTGIDQAVLCRFMQGQCGMLMETLDRIVEVLPMRVTVDAPYAETPGNGHKLRSIDAETKAHARKLKVKK